MCYRYIIEILRIRRHGKKRVSRKLTPGQLKWVRYVPCPVCGTLISKNPSAAYSSHKQGCPEKSRRKNGERTQVWLGRTMMLILARDVCAICYYEILSINETTNATYNLKRLMNRRHGYWQSSCLTTMHDFIAMPQLLFKLRRRIYNVAFNPFQFVWLRGFLWPNKGQPEGMDSALSIYFEQP